MTTIVHHLTLEDILFTAARHYRHGPNGPSPSAATDANAAQAPPAAGAALVDRLRFLLELAANSAAGSEWVAATADSIVTAVMSLQAFERDHLDPRRRVSLARAARMANTVRSMREAGLSRGACVTALRERHGLSRSRVYELLALCPGT